MRIHRATIRNFRLLADVELVFEEETTVIVGRNNSGKTSLSEVMRRLLEDGNPTFQLEDFSSACYEEFCSALAAYNQRSEDNKVRSLLPAIELHLLFKYDPSQPDLGSLAPFVIDLDPDTTEALVVLRYELKDGGIATFFEGLSIEPLNEKTRLEFFRTLRQRIPVNFQVKIWAEDPNDSENRRQVQVKTLRSLIKTDFINAQRGLDDITSRETDVLAKILEGLFATAASKMANSSDRSIAEALATAVQEIQGQLDGNFGGLLKSLLPTLESFGYPGLNGQELYTETTLDVRRLLSNFTKVRYAGCEGVALPESYNGLGMRNLIFILLQLVGFHKAYQAEATAPGVHLVFIEEPEAHLHPQMQEVFIKQLSKIATDFSGQAGDPEGWPVQFVVSTHSSHIANAVGFENIRYFLSEASGAKSGVQRTKIKDLREGLKGSPVEQKNFVHQYLTLTRCDLFFADKAILVEGLSERLLLPTVIRKLEEAEPACPKLSTQYMTIMEVGGAYAHLFFDLLDFLELRSLIITDLDSIAEDLTKRPVHQGTKSSNACLKDWFAQGEPLTLTQILAKTDQDKLKDKKRIAYQCPEKEGGPCGRTFEDAFVIANASLFGLSGACNDELEVNAGKEAKRLKKSEFALRYAIMDTNWTIPKYILDGVRWLAHEGTRAADPVLAIAFDIGTTNPTMAPEISGTISATNSVINGVSIEAAGPIQEGGVGVEK